MISPGSAETNVGWNGKLHNDLMSSCLRNILTKALLKSDNSSSSYNRKCWGCFFWETVYNYYTNKNSNRPKVKDQTQGNWIHGQKYTSMLAQIQIIQIYNKSLANISLPQQRYSNEWSNIPTVGLSPSGYSSIIQSASASVFTSILLTPSHTGHAIQCYNIKVTKTALTQADWLQTVKH